MSRGLPLDRGWIEAHIPHRGRMCLIDAVVEWSAELVLCSSTSHRAPDHPLRAHGRLGIACGIELAAQTMAVHGAILARGPGVAQAADRPADGCRPRAGLLASVRGVRMYVTRLDDVGPDLLCRAVRLLGDADTALYQFELRTPAACLMQGRATVVLDAQHLDAGAAAS